MITYENYQFSFYNNQDLVAFVSSGAEENGEEIYFVTTVNSRNQQDLFQRSFPSLPAAIQNINTRFAHWPFQDTNQAVSQEKKCGCSSGSGGCGN